MKKFILALAGLGLFATACKKEDPIDTSKTKYLMDKYWRMTSSLYTADVSDPLSLPVDIFPGFPTCRKDDYYHFATASTGEVHDHFDKCSGADPDESPFFWNLSNNETYLRIYTNPEFPEESIHLAGDVTYVSIDTFVLTYLDYNEVSEKTSRYTNTYVKVVP
jgi:hypothetical protein